MSVGKNFERVDFMKKIFESYAMAWAVMFALFQVISFAVPGWAGVEKYTPTFWIGYICITISFLVQLVCAYIALKAENSRKAFYHISLAVTSYIGLLLSFLFGGLCMLVSAFPLWAGIMLCAAVLAFNVVSIIKASVSATLVVCTDEKEKSQLFFLKSVISDSELLLSMAKSETIKKDCKRVYETARYSDPVSCEELSAIEGEIAVKFSMFTKAVKEDDASEVKEIADGLVGLLEDRNKKCRLLK